MEVALAQCPPGDPRMIDTIVYQLKSQGIFDQFRKECIADVDTKPAYQNLHQRVESTVSGFLADQAWRPDLNKNLLRDSLRKHIHESGFLEMGVERIVDQVVNPKIMTVFVPQVEDVVYNFLGIEKPKKRPEPLYSKPPPFSFNIDHSEIRKEISLTDMLPKDLDPVSPESDATKKTDNSAEEGELNDKDDEECSPSFKPIREANENSCGSSLSGISGLTSPDSHLSSISFNGVSKNDVSQVVPNETFNSESKISKVSNGNQFVCDDKKPHLKHLMVETGFYGISNHAKPQIQLFKEESAKTLDVRKAPIGSDSSDDEDDKEGSSTSSRPSSSISGSSSGSSSDSSSSDDSVSSKVELSEVTTSLNIAEKALKKEKSIVREDKSMKSEHSNVNSEEKSLKNEKREALLRLKVEKLEKVICKDKTEEFAIKKSYDYGDTVTKKEKKDEKSKKDSKVEKGFPKQEMEGKSTKKVEKEENLKKSEKDDIPVQVVRKDEKERKVVKNHERDENVTRKVEKEDKSTRRLEKEEKLTKPSEQGEHVKKDMKDDKLSITTKKTTKEDKFSKKDEKEDRTGQNSEKDNLFSVDDKLITNRSVNKDQKDKSLKINEKGLQKNGEGKSSSKEGNHDKKLTKKDREDKTLKRDDKSLKKDEKSTKNLEKEKTFKKEDRHKTDTDSSTSQDSKQADGKQAKTSEEQHHSHKVHKPTDKDNVKLPDKQPSKDSDKARRDGKSKFEDKSKHGDKSKQGDKFKQDNKSKHNEKPKHEDKDKAKEEDKTKHENRHKTKNGKTDKDRSTSNKDLSSKEKSGKHDEEKPEMNTDSKSKLSSKSKDNKKEKGKLTDDHSRHRDKRSDDRGSTDRDSNGATRDRSSSSARSQTTGSKDTGNREKKGTNSGSSGKTGKGGNADASEKSEGIEIITAADTVTPESKSPVKRQISNSNALIPCEGEYICTNKEGKLILKIKKPKIAANIFEVRKIMQLRRSLAILERKRQKEFRLAQGFSSSDDSPTESSNMQKKDLSPVRVNEATLEAGIPVPRPILPEIDVPTVEVPPLVGVPSAVEVAPPVLILPIDTPPTATATLPFVIPSPCQQTSDEASHEFDDDDVDMKFFEIPEVNEYDKYFLDYMKLLNESETLSELDVCSVLSEDLDDFAGPSKCSNIIDDEVKQEKDIKHARTVDFCRHVSFERKTFEPSCLNEEKCVVPATIIESSRKTVVGSSITSEDIPHQKNTRLMSRQVKSEDMNSVSNTLFENDRSTESGLPVSIKSKAELPKSLEENASTIPTVKPQLPDDVHKVGLPSKPSNSLALHPKVNNGNFKTLSKPGSYKTDIKTNETVSLVAEMGPPSVSQPLPEKRETRRSRKPNSRYSNDSFTSDLSETASQPESQTTEDDDHERKSIYLSKSKIFDIVVGGLNDGYDANFDNNNGKVAVEKIKESNKELNSSNLKKKEKGKTQVQLLMQAESSMPTPESHKSGDSSSSGSIEMQKKQKLKLGPCKRLGLPRVKPSNVELLVNQIARVVTPVSADFVMPLSPESDVSASSVEQAKKVLLDSSPSKSEENTSTTNDTDKRSTRRTGTVSTPASRGQRYSSDDLYKPRPLFNHQSRRTRAHGLPSNVEALEQNPEVAMSSGVKRKAASIMPDSTSLPKRRR